jgi:hypothetical protein
MDITLSVVELVSVSVGAGAALIFDFFFLLSLRDHKVRQYEIKSLQRLSLCCIVGAMLALFSYIILLAMFIESSTTLELGFSLTKILILTIALLTALTLRKIHLPTLARYQSSYLHLSDSMVHHQDSLVATAAFSSVSWLAIILLTTLEARGVDIPFLNNGLAVMLVYIVIGYAASKAAVHIKKKIISR